MASEQVEQSETTSPGQPDARLIMGKKPRTVGLIVAGLILVVVIDLFAFILSRPSTRSIPPDEVLDRPSRSASSTARSTSPSPHVIWTASGEAASGGLFEISITDTPLHDVLVTVLLLIVMSFVGRGKAAVPGFLQNFVEWTYESLAGFGPRHGWLAGQSRTSPSSPPSSCSSWPSTGAVWCRPSA